MILQERGASDGFLTHGLVRLTHGLVRSELETTLFNPAERSQSDLKTAVVLHRKTSSPLEFNFYEVYSHRHQDYDKINETTPIRQ
jgi:hypothetical protein